MRASINTQLAHDQEEYDREGADEEVRSAINRSIIAVRAVMSLRRRQIVTTPGAFGTSARRQAKSSLGCEYNSHLHDGKQNKVRIVNHIP